MSSFNETLQCALCVCLVFDWNAHGVWHQNRFDEAPIAVQRRASSSSYITRLSPAEYVGSGVFVATDKPMPIAELIEELRIANQRLVEVTRANEDLQAANAQLEQRLVAIEEQALSTQSTSAQLDTSGVGADAAAWQALAESRLQILNRVFTAKARKENLERAVHNAALDLIAEPALLADTLARRDERMKALGAAEALEDIAKDMGIDGGKAYFATMVYRELPEILTLKVGVVDADELMRRAAELRQKAGV